MSVVARKRNVSKYEFYKNAVFLRKQITLFLLRDFGVKMVRNLKIRTGRMDEDDAKKLTEILTKYNLERIPGEYPEWLIEKLRDSVWGYLRDMMKAITSAYSIWATNRTEAEERRIWQDRAVAACENLYKDFELAIELLPVDVQKYMPYVDLIEREIALLKGWRKQDNRKNKSMK